MSTLTETYESRLAELTALQKQAQSYSTAVPVALGRQLLKALRAVGDIEGNLYYPNLGRTGDALERYKEAIATAQKIDSADLQLEDSLELAAVHDGAGDLFGWTGNVVERLKNYFKSLEIREKLSEANQDNPQLKRALMFSYSRIGDALANKGKTGASQSYSLALQLAKELAPPNTTDAKALEDLWICYLNIGESQLDSGDCEQALNSFSECVKLVEQYAPSLPLDPDKCRNSLQGCRDLWISYSKLADVQLKLNRLDEARQNYEQAKQIAQEIYNANEANFQARCDLANALDKMGYFMLATGGVDDAETHYNDSLQHLQQLATVDNTNMRNRHNLAQLHMNLAQVHEHRANSQKISSSEQKQHWQNAHSCYSASLEVWASGEEGGSSYTVARTACQKVRNIIEKLEARAGVLAG
ncbi:tetratricopeptide repeat protein [Gloeobacter kilaueensis]|uniref:Tetratricopeptide repeat protein n=1 Tax=Gloeobacter kilaueensis (strain ATCC BAA-2537 / CCAP 1431/1 / ULC 316 / JS1) TaxID=1183438 RepID=U5QJS9_GLOK1|nr:tetratricopeptide repeat protein [Gloeobacter kilaueensis]AGY59148.1 hypothetical protein GKIL_2902 [Gloeobacter kilaueensis JS1]